MLRRVFDPWRHPSTWWTLTHLVTDIVVGAVTFTVVITLLALSLGLLVTFFLAIPVFWLLMVVSRGFAHLERSRLAALLGVDLPDPVPPLQGPSWWRRLLERARSGARWKEVAYLLLLPPRSAAPSHQRLGEAAPFVGDRAEPSEDPLVRARGHDLDRPGVAPVEQQPGPGDVVGRRHQDQPLPPVLLREPGDLLDLAPGVVRFGQEADHLERLVGACTVVRARSTATSVDATPSRASSQPLVEALAVTAREHHDRVGVAHRGGRGVATRTARG